MTEEKYVADPRRWKALAVCMAGAFIAMLDISIVNVALPSIEAGLHAGSAQVQLIVAGYTLALALLVVPMGRLGDVYGRRNMFAVGIAGFGLASLGAGLAPNATVLAAMRVLQGCFAGVQNPQVTGIIQQLFRGAERGKAFGFMGALIGIATAVGPIAGGSIIALFGAAEGWRWVFFINVPVVAVVVPLALKLMPKPEPRSGTAYLDLPGVAIVGLATASFMVPFIFSGTEGGDALPAWRWGFLPLAAVLIFALTKWEQAYHARTNSAVFDPQLLRNLGFRFGVGIGGLYFAGFTSTFLIVTMVLQQGLGYTPLQAGLVGVPFAIGSGLSSQFAGRVITRYGRKLVVIALCVVLVGLLTIDMVMRFAPEAHFGWILAIVMFCTGSGAGAVISPNQTLTLTHVPPRMGGVAGAVLTVGQQLGGAIGMSIVLSGFFAGIPTLGPRLAAAQTLLVGVAIITLTLLVAIFDMRRRQQQS
ncbi:MAG: MFS transporter [Propionibacteriaceae bacterium]|jgi:EmrB/QacA subfamily drug resistance transporter|nr:MFS transporter [Propionibacteriaceae bacterium]